MRRDEGDRIRELEEQVAAQEKTIAALTESIESAQSEAGGSLSAVYGQQIILERQVAERTANLERALRKIQDLNRSLTEQTRALREERALLQAIFNNVPYGISWKDPEGRYRAANSYFLGLAGLTREVDIIGCDDFDLCWKAQAASYREDDRRVMESGTPRLDIEETLTDKDGRLLILNTSKVPMLSDDGGNLGILGLLRDVTENRMLQEELHQSRRLEAIGRLAAGIAHEINTPMQYIGDNLHFLNRAIDRLLAFGGEISRLSEEPALPEPCRERLQAAVTSARLSQLGERCPHAAKSAAEGVSIVTRIVLAMKGFAHPGGGEKVPYDLNHGIETTVTVSRNEWKYSADVETALDPAVPPLLAFGGELNQVILNMIVNAAHAITERFPEATESKGLIRIESRRDGEWVEVRISDNGAGIPPDAKNRIFEPFFTTKEVGKGSGQGLALARSVIVERHHGEITFESHPGEGTTFIIRLPLGGDTARAEAA